MPAASGPPIGEIATAMHCLHKHSSSRESRRGQNATKRRALALILPQLSRTVRDIVIVDRRFSRRLFSKCLTTITALMAQQFLYFV